MHLIRHILHTGLGQCYDTSGAVIPCRESGQDAAYGLGISRYDNRFSEQEGLVKDRLTGLVWPRQADTFIYPLSWNETLDEVARLNEQNFLGHSDWRLPNRKELRSLVSHGTKKPALPKGHPFQDVFLGWYWTSTTSAMAPAYAWRVHFEGGRMFYGNKNDPSMGWPVRGESPILARTGQSTCFDGSGKEIDCTNSFQDGALRKGKPWPAPRFEPSEHGITDMLTGLIWAKRANLVNLVDWQEALDAIAELNRSSQVTWRLPNINELESLVDASHCDPALPDGHPFEAVQEAYWSSTTSFFETDWSYALYMHKGAVGVGFKQKAEFHCWSVAGPL